MVQIWANSSRLFLDASRLGSTSIFRFDTFGSSILRAFLGEVGDMTFFATVLLVLWCPWQGSFPQKNSESRQMFVVAASFASLSIHVLLAALFSEPVWAAWRRHEVWVLELLSALVFALLAARAHMGHPSDAFPAQLPFSSGKTTAESGRQHGREESLTSLPSSGAGLASLRRPSSGSTPPAPKSGDWCRDIVSGPICTGITTFLTTSLCVFLAEVDDKSWISMTSSGRQGLDIVFGCLLGLFPAVALAGLIGYALWRVMQPSSIRLVAALGMGAMSLVSLSQAGLHWNVLNVNGRIASESLSVRPVPA